MTDSAQAWAEAFTKAQSEFPEITKDKTVNTGSFSYKYADLHSILDAVNPILKENGLSVGQSAVSENGSIGVETRIYHKLGHVETFGPLFLPGGGDAKAAGSAVTYARRYSLCAALGIAADEDDDGAAASRPTKPSSQNLDSEKAGIVVDGTEPHCPACLAINGEVVGVWHNDKKPFWRCKNKAGDCAGTSDDGKYQWSGWDQSWERSAQAWIDEHGPGEPVREEPEQSPGDWLKTRVGIFKQWTPEESRQAYSAAMEELGYQKLSSLDRAQSVFDAMKQNYAIEYPADDAERPF